jgi:hypothetical protein
VFEVDGDRVEVPTGTLVFAPPSTSRLATAMEEGPPSSRWRALPEKRMRPGAGSSRPHSHPCIKRARTPRPPTA